MRARIVNRVLAGEQRSPAWRADGRGGVPAMKDGPFARQPIEVRRLPVLATVERHIAIAEIVGVDEEDVGGTILGENGLERQQDYQEEDDAYSHDVTIT